MAAASCPESEEIVQLLMENGVDLNTRDFQDSTALDWAFMCKNEATAQLLVKNGAMTGAAAKEAFDLTASNEVDLEEGAQMVSD